MLKVFLSVCSNNGTITSSARRLTPDPIMSQQNASVNRKRYLIARRIKHNMEMPTRAWLEKYLVVTRLGIIAILGFAGSGKSQPRAVVAQLYMVHSWQDHV